MMKSAIFNELKLSVSIRFYDTFAAETFASLYQVERSFPRTRYKLDLEFEGERTRLKERNGWMKGGRGRKRERGRVSEWVSQLTREEGEKGTAFSPSSLPRALFSFWTFGARKREMGDPVKASPRAIMSHLLMNPVESESSSISSRDEDSFQEMPLKLVKREIENSTDDEFDDDLQEEEEQEEEVTVQPKKRITVNHPVMYPSSLISRQVNELSLMKTLKMKHIHNWNTCRGTNDVSLFRSQNSQVEHHDTNIFGGDQNSVIRKGISNGE